MSDKLYLWFDAETGDLSPKGGDLLTIYFAMCDGNGKFIEELDLKLKPDDRGPVAQAGALRTNKINLREHAEDPQTITYSEAKVKLKEFIKRHLKKNGRYSNIIASGFNVRFDIRFVNYYLLNEEEWEELVHYKPHDVMDGVDFLKYHGWLPSDVGSLGKTGDYFQVPEGMAHTAKDDIIRTIGVDNKIKELMESKKSGGQTIDLISILESE